MKTLSRRGFCVAVPAALAAFTVNRIPDRPEMCVSNLRTCFEGGSIGMRITLFKNGVNGMTLMVPANSKPGFYENTVDVDECRPDDELSIGVEYL